MINLERDRVYIYISIVVWNLVRFYREIDLILVDDNDNLDLNLMLLACVLHILLFCFIALKFMRVLLWRVMKKIDE